MSDSSSWDDEAASVLPVQVATGAAIGELRITQCDGFDCRLVIDHADRRIWVTAEWVETGRWCVEQLPLGMREVSTVGDVFTVKGSNRTVVYRLVDYDQPTDRYLAEWPD